jgi:cyanophycinase
MSGGPDDDMLHGQKIIARHPRPVLETLSEEDSMRRFALGAALLLAAAASAQEIGPRRGTLVLVGGALQDTFILDRFLDLAGGPKAPLVLIPTAGEGDVYDELFSGVADFRNAGFEDVTVLHTRDRKVADSETFVAPIRRARAVWFPGGRQWRLADAYLGTRTENELHALLDRGGVIGGTSAGATIQGSFLVRGDTKNNHIVIGDHLEGFSFLRNVAVDQHLLARNRHFDLIQVVEKYPQLLGIGIDEDTAIVVEGDRFEVVGKSVVAIYDNRRTLADGGRFYFLRAGDTYDLKTREARPKDVTEEPFDNVKVAPWPDR